jgi:Protein of unknown function, DUF481
MYKLLFITFLLLGWVQAHTQLNESDTAKLQIRASLAGNYQKGNVNILTVRSKLDMVWAPNRNWVFKSQNNSLYQAFASIKADNDLFSRNYLYYKPQRTIYPFAIAYIAGNYRRKIDLRLFAGAGITWQVLNKPHQVIKLSANAVYETSRFKGMVYNDSRYNGSNQIDLWRGTLFLGGWHYPLPHTALRLYYDAYWQPAFNHTNNYRTQFDLGADLPIWKGLSFNVVYTFTHEQVTIATIKREDKILTFGLAYNFKRKH